MSSSSFTFRCPECRKLLAASRSRVGTMVLCPKCQSDLVVPAPPDVGHSPSSGQPHPSTSPSSGPIQVGPSAEYRDPSLAAGVEGPPVFLPIKIEDDPLSLRPEAGTRPHRIPDRPSSKETPARPPSPPPATEPPSPGAATTTNTTPAPAMAPPAPGEEMVSIRPEPTVRDPAPRRSDVVLPRTAVLLWSFAMLLALIFAFAAGLLAGHFLWPTPPAVATDPAPSPEAAGPGRPDRSTS